VKFNGGLNSAWRTKFQVLTHFRNVNDEGVDTVLDRVAH